MARLGSVDGRLVAEAGASVHGSCCQSDNVIE